MIGVELVRRGRILFFVILASLLCTMVWFFTHPMIRIRYVVESGVLENDENNEAREMLAAPRENIFFLKTHKCAGSTVQNVLMRLAAYKGLNMALPEVNNYLGYPRPFSEEFVGEKLLTEDGKYNILAHHCRLSDGVRQVMYPDAAWVTIVREPAELFESLYSYYGLGRHWNMSLEEVVEAATEVLKERYLGRFGLDQMSFDMGSEGETAEELIRRVEESFDLVMVAEYMEASLVMLADLMNWPLDYVTSLKLNSRPEDRRHHMVPLLKQQLRQLNPVDTKLYDHFLERFKRRAREYGRDALLARVSQLLHLNDRVWARCVRDENLSGFALTVGYNVSDSEECSYIAMNELDFTQVLRDRQTHRLATLAHLRGLY